MSVRNYINNARNQYQNWAGDAAPMNGGYRNLAGQSNTFNPAAGVSSQYRPASGNGCGNNAPQSQPYILTVSNASATAVQGFDVLGAFTYIGNAGFVNGSLTISGVTISSAISNVNYQQFLYQSMNQPFSVGLTYIESVAGSSSQITQTFTLNTQDANGNQLLRTIVPTIDPYQQQSTIVAVKQLYSIDGFTKLINAVTAEPLYLPNEADIKIVALNTLLTNMKTVNTNVITAYTAYSNARISRNTTLYAADTGLKDIAAEVKKYIKSVFGATSPQYKQVSKLKFTKPR